MKKYLSLFILLLPALSLGQGVWAQNPFMSKNPQKQIKQAPVLPNKFLYKIVIWQQQLKQKMSELIREVRTTGNIKPLMFLMMLSFTYGAIHAAGPGHGKFVAMSYFLSRKASIIGGLLFGTFIAFFHGLSGAVGVLGLRYIIQKSVSETLGTVTTVTQIVSFGLITLLGLSILLKNGYTLCFKRTSNPDTKNLKESTKRFLPWAVAVGLVPCPAVVMVMLFCLSMDALTLGLLLAAFISLGMAATISFVVIAVVMGRGFSLRAFSKKRAEIAESILGIVSGIIVTVLGSLFLITAIG